MLETKPERMVLRHLKLIMRKDARQRISYTSRCSLTKKIDDKHGKVPARDSDLKKRSRMMYCIVVCGRALYKFVSQLKHCTVCRQ